MSALAIALSVISTLVQATPPPLSVDGFSWAENLAFDGVGGLFVSEAVRGELWRISVCGDAYCKAIHVSTGVSQVGGLAITPDGSRLYAGVTFEDKTKGIIETSTAAVANNTESVWKLVTKTKNQPNGMAADWSVGVLYCTDEGTGSEEGGTVVAVDIATGSVETIGSGISGADGAWFDPVANLLYVGKLIDLKVWVYSTESKTSLGEYPGFSSLPLVFNMLDDITLGPDGSDTNNIGSTVLYGADFTGRKIVKCTLDGTVISTIDIPEGIKLFEPTSVRFGKGPGFSEYSLFITEGGGATSRETKRRVLQIS